MKKSLLALAVLGAFAGAAAAQSSVTIYGKLDMALAKTNDGTSTLAGATTTGDAWGLDQQAGSRLGFRGTEDLGGGLRANFLIEHRFNNDTGAQTSSVNFWQQAWVGLSGGFGEIRLGRDYTPLFWVALAGDPFGYDTVGQAGVAHNQLGILPVRFSNSFSYKTPNLNGFSALVQVAAKESTASGTKNPFGANVVYSAGPLYIGLGYENAGIQTPAALGAVKTSVWTATGAYNFGFARLGLSYTTGKAENAGGVDVADRDNWTLFANAPVGGGDLRALFAVRDNDLNNTDIKKFGVGYHYPLSKRTKVYADLGTAKETGLDRRTGFDIGIQHNF